ncbi:hypothetical protein KO11_01550 [Escherichia coli KO11FL]|nr:hypothetical protein KO11_01550 [Escherichia coli KO11FL]
MEAGLIGGEPGALDFHAAEATYVDATIRATAPWASPQFQLGHFGWAVVDEIIHDILLTQPVATRYCIVKVIFEAVMILRDSGGAPFCSNGCIDSLEVRKKPGGHWIIRDLMGLDLVGLASL